MDMQTAKVDLDALGAWLKYDFATDIAPLEMLVLLVRLEAAEEISN